MFVFGSSDGTVVVNFVVVVEVAKGWVPGGKLTGLEFVQCRSWHGGGGGGCHVFGLEWLWDGVLCG